MENPIKPVSQFEIVNKIAAMLNLGDYGKVENFISKTVKTLEREVDTLERSKKNQEHNFSTSLATLKEELEDAQMPLDETYANVDPKDLATNEMQRSFMETYLSRIDIAEAKVVGIEKKIEDATEASAKIIEDLDKEIAVRNKRISMLSKG
jgi:prefoldin subunit 5